MDILSGAGKGFGGIFGAGGKGFQKDLKQEDFTGVATADVQLTYHEWVLVGYYTIPAQQEVRVGYGNANQQFNQGYVYLRLDSSSGACKGKVRIKIESANGERSDMIGEWELQSLAGDKNDKNKMIALPEDMRFTAREDDKILIEIRNDDGSAWTPTGTIIDFDDADNYIKIPITAYYTGR